MALNRVDQYLFLPGCCGICRSSNLPTLDTGISLDYFNDPNSDNPSAMNILYICADCAVEMARLVLDSRNLELTRLGTNQELSAMVNAFNEANYTLSLRVEELENALRVVNTIKAPRKTETTKSQFKAVSPDEVEI